MALLERVSTLVRANLNDLIDKAEEPEKMIKQVILDMNNQLLQVKTQVAIAIADQHLLDKKKLENDDKIQEWMRKAELAVDKKQDDLARAALLRVESYRDLSSNFAQQLEDQKAQVENLKSALRNLDQKLAEANAKADLLIAQHRRARAANRATDAQSGMNANTKSATFDRMKKKVATPGRRRGRPPRRLGKRRPHRAVVNRAENKARSITGKSCRKERTRLV
jgi:phage shock protein A